jgi:hypothetical protein
MTLTDRIDVRVAGTGAAAGVGGWLLGDLGQEGMLGGAAGRL